MILGILIALGLEQGVEAYHWNQRVRDAHRALAAEIQDQANTYALRAAMTPCVERRLAGIEAILADLDHGRRVAPVADFARPLGSSNHQDIWQALEAAGVLAHFDPEELIAYSKLYEVSSQVDFWSTMGGQDWSAIKLVVVIRTAGPFRTRACPGGDQPHPHTELRPGAPGAAAAGSRAQVRRGRAGAAGPLEAGMPPLKRG